MFNSEVNWIKDILDKIHRLLRSNRRDDRLQERILEKLTTIIATQEKLMLNTDKLVAAQTALVAKVEGLTTVTAAVLENDKVQIATLAALEAEIKAIRDGSNEAEVQAKLDSAADGIQSVSDAIAARSADLAEATKKNTDAADEPPAPV